MRIEDFGSKNISTSQCRTCWQVQWITIFWQLQNVGSRKIALKKIIILSFFLFYFDQIYRRLASNCGKKSTKKFLLPVASYLSSLILSFEFFLLNECLRAVVLNFLDPEDPLSKLVLRHPNRLLMDPLILIKEAISGLFFYFCENHGPQAFPWTPRFKTFVIWHSKDFMSKDDRC